MKKIKIELTYKQLKEIIKCMQIADDEYGPLEDNNFYILLEKLKKQFIDKNSENKI